MVSFGKKAKKESASSEAAVSSIPVPPAENSLVIDLPEGQKLVLGRMEDGTVIEVATWRGTGRPDSRTNRLMLGVSSTVSPPASSDPSEEVESPTNFVGRVLQGLLKSMSHLFGTLRARSVNLISDWIRKVKVHVSKRGDLTPKIDIPVGKNLKDSGKGIEDFEFDKWLQSIERELPNDGEVTPSSKNLSAEMPRSEQGVKKVSHKGSPGRKKTPIKKSQKRK